MWIPSRRQLCWAFLAASLLSVTSFFLHLWKGSFSPKLVFSALCHKQCPGLTKVALFCLPGTPQGPSGSLALHKPAASPEPSGIWTIQPEGRFGNQMGQYATLYALAKLNGKQAFILPDMHATLAPVFKVTLPVLDKEVAARMPWRLYPLQDWMAEEYAHLGGQDMLQFTGFPCSWTFYHHLRAEIHREFSLHRHVHEDAQAFLHWVRHSRGKGRSLTFVGVHVRRGDYVELMPKHWRGVVADGSYLEQALAWFRVRYPDAIFVVTSNGMEWCRENIDPSRGDVVFAGDGDEVAPGSDFALLTQCNHTVMTIGTFGYWAAYLAAGKTIYLANYTLPDSQLLNVFKPQAAFLPEWVGIPADLSPLLH
ncbi:galactoside alpha-(1,2)-fucosyltransferase 1 [Phascolarctos cinereus]|uniref:L-Fucosyltransferase n=1 Tax=Phascolarctos cinereus TaxID=38626 RepID=A0A6P5LS31_PHACI|nr:galactoside 2-alpha-L-fucosyltransferase 1 [Phascolarctos cinereus]